MKRLEISMTIAILAMGISCGKKAGDTTDQATTKPVENITATKDQRERRERSELYCKSKGIPVYENPNSLFVDPEDKVTVRTQDEVVDRALALCYLGLKSEGLEQNNLDQMDKDFAIMTKLSPGEKAYATAQQPTEQQKINANWRYESLHVLLWALGYIDELSYPDQMCNVGDDVEIILKLKEKNFRQNAKLRSKQEILDQADLILRLNWACVNARVKNERMPGGLDASVVYERHYSLNWLIRYMDQEWDDVTTDT
jgi:hypothetical protein